MAVPPLRNIRAQAAPLHGAGVPNQQKRRPKASFLLAEMEGFELWLDFLLCPKCTVNFVQTVPCFIEHRLADVGIAISYGI